MTSGTLKEKEVHEYCVIDFRLLELYSPVIELGSSVGKHPTARNKEVHTTGNGIASSAADTAALPLDGGVAEVVVV